MGERETAAAAPLSWPGIVRLGIVQAALGAIVVLVTSTLNRVMVVEYALPAVLPGLLVALHYLVQMARPGFGYASDLVARRTPWIVGGMAILASGEILAAFGTVSHAHWYGLALSVLGYALVGLGVSAAGTSLLVLLARRVDEPRRAAAATLMWILMIAGFAITSSIVGQYLDPFSPRRLVMVTTCAAGCAFLIAAAAIWRVESSGRCAAAPAQGAGGTARSSFSSALRLVWSEPEARNFTLFIFISMLAYSAQELLLEPFAGLVFGYSLGASAKLSGLWHAAALAGMVAVGIACSGRRRARYLHTFTIGGCCASAAAILNLACANLVGPHWPVRMSVAALGVANGVFAVGAVGSMMQLAHRGAPGNAGVRLGLWGASQAVAFALGGVVATGVVDASRWLAGSAGNAFAIVFCMEGCLFSLAAWFAIQTTAREQPAAFTAEVTV